MGKAELYVLTAIVIVAIAAIVANMIVKSRKDYIKFKEWKERNPE